MASRTDVALCARNILRLNTKACGDDAAAYRPECWLEAGPERLAVMEEAFYLVFGFGRTRCIGENSQIVRIEECRRILALIVARS